MNDEQKQEICAIISTGCDRETACKYLGWSAAQLRRELRCDARFSKRLARAEATPELSHMQNLRNAARDEKHWRASVWWLERRSPERYGRRSPDAISADQLRQVIEQLAEVIVEGVASQTEREQLLDRFTEIASAVHGDESGELGSRVEESGSES